MNKENERVKYLLQNWSHLQLAREYEKLENIIKEVREYIEEMQIWLADFEDFGITTKGLLEILEKEVN